MVQDIPQADVLFRICQPQALATVFTNPLVLANTLHAGPDTDGSILRWQASLVIGSTSCQHFKGYRKI